MVDLNSLAPEIPPALKALIEKVVGHSRVLQHKVVFVNASLLEIECDWKVSLGSRDNDPGVSAKGVLAVEPVRWHFPFDFPVHAVFPSLRCDFPRAEFPHIYPSRHGTRVRPCISEAGITSELLANGILSLLHQLDVWLDRAAQDTLMIEEQGWEPVIFENKQGSFSDVNGDLLEFAETETRKQSTTGGGKIIAGSFVNFGSPKQPLIIANSSVLSECKEISVFHLFFPESSATKKFQNLTIEKRNDVLAFASSLEGEPLLPKGEIVLSKPNLTLTEKLKLYLEKKDRALSLNSMNEPEKAVVVVIYVPRPHQLIGGYSNVEVLPFFVRLASTNLSNPEVIPLEFIRGSAQDVLQKLSFNNPRCTKDVAFLGVGSVGSKVALSLAKTGSYKFHLKDNSLFKPHNFARHGLSQAGTLHGLPKAILVNSSIENFGANSSYCLADLSYGNIELDKTNEIIIESTGSELVSHNLSKQSNLYGQVYQVGLYGESTMGYLAIEPNSRNRDVRIDDIEAYLYALSAQIEQINKALFQSQGATRQIVGHGCSSETTIIPDTTLNLVCAALTAKIDHSIYDEKEISDVGELHLCFKSKDSSISWKSFCLPKTHAHCLTHNGRQWEVRISGLVANSIFEKRKLELPSETGGAVLGYICELTDRIYVTYEKNLAPIEQTPSEYTVNQTQLYEIDSHFRELTRGRLHVLGTWHSHTVPSSPSMLDIETFQTLNQCFNLPVVIMLMCDGVDIKLVQLT